MQGQDIYKYTGKISRPRRKSDFSMRKLDISRAFQSFDVKREVTEAIQAQISNVGYTQPGHGWKRRQELLDSDDDVKEMYSVYGKRTDISQCLHVLLFRRHLHNIVVRFAHTHAMQNLSHFPTP